MNEIISNFKDIVLNKYARFDGKADRAEFWRFFLAMLVIGAAFSLLLTAFAKVHFLYWIIYVIMILVDLALLVPNLAVTVRRLRDVGKDWPWILIVLIPLIGVIWLLVLLAKPSLPDQNPTPVQ